MVGTPIFDELRDLFVRSHGRFGAAGALGPDPRAGGGSPEAGRPLAKIVIAGGRGVGKTTFVRSVSDADLIGVDPATDVGRIALHPDLVLHLFGTSELPQSGFGGALGAVVLVDARRIEDTFATLSYFENSSDVPFIVVINIFGNVLRHQLDEVREALALGPDVPLTTCDARDPRSTARALQELVSYTMNVGVRRPHSPPELHK